MKPTLMLICLLFSFSIVACGDEKEESPTQIAESGATTTQAEEPTSGPEPSPTVEPTATPTDTPSPTMTATHTPSPTATSTPRSTSTPYPTPTQIPEGYHLSESGGFSLTYPDSWLIVEESAGYLSLMELDSGLFMLITSTWEEEPLAFDELVDEISAAMGLESSNTVVEERSEITVAGDAIGERALVFPLGAGASVPAYEIVSARQEPRTFVLIIIGEQAVIDGHQSVLQEVYDGLEFFPFYLYGLDRDETLVLHNRDPLAEDLDPATQTNSAADYVGYLYSGLVRLSPQLRVTPDLAESWTISPGGSVYTFTLRSDLAFADGRPLTAHDVKYSWERAVDPETASITAGTYLGDIVGVGEKLDGEAEEISGVQVEDDQTLVVTLDGPKPYFLPKLSYPTSYIVDKESVENGGEDWMFSPNASGPYHLRRYLEMEVIIFERNDNYHTVGKIPNIAFLLGRFGSPLSFYEAGEIDITGILPADIERISQPDDPLHDQLHSTTSLCTSFIQLDNNQPPLDDPLVRQAFAMAIDKAAINERFGEGIPLIAQTILPPAMPGFSDNLKQQIYDPAAAVELLAESSYGSELPPITISAIGYGDQEDEFTVALANMWQENLGVEYTIDYFDPVRYTEAAQESHGQASVWGWCADYPDPENFLDLLFHSESEFNLSAYSNSEVDALLESARSELDPGRRMEIYKEAEQLLLEDVAAIPLNHSVNNLLVSSRIGGYTMSPMGVAQYQLLSIDPDSGDG